MRNLICILILLSTIICSGSDPEFFRFSYSGTIVASGRFSDGSLRYPVGEPFTVTVEAHKDFELSNFPPPDVIPEPIGELSIGALNEVLCSLFLFRPDVTSTPPSVPGFFIPTSPDGITLSFGAESCTGNAGLTVWFYDPTGTALDVGGHGIFQPDRWQNIIARADQGPFDDTVPDRLGWGIVGPHTVIPEPSSIILLFAMVGFSLRRLAARKIARQPIRN